MYFVDFEVFAIALLNRGRDEKDIHDWAEFHRIAVMSDCENDLGGNEAACTVG